jgi:hypothetical protein
VTVSEDNIDVVMLQTLQGALQALDDVLLAQTTGVGLLSRCSKEDFGRQNVFVSRIFKLLKCLSHLDLALACGVDLSGIEEVDAVIPSRRDALGDNVALLLQDFSWVASLEIDSALTVPP